MNQAHVKFHIIVLLPKKSKQVAYHLHFPTLISMCLRGYLLHVYIYSFINYAFQLGNQKSNIYNNMTKIQIR